MWRPRPTTNPPIRWTEFEGSLDDLGLPPAVEVFQNLARCQRRSQGGQHDRRFVDGPIRGGYQLRSYGRPAKIAISPVQLGTP